MSRWAARTFTLAVCLVGAIAANTARAQDLHVYATGFTSGVADVEFDAAGNLYGTGGAGGSGRIWKVAPGGGVASLFVSSGLVYPWGLAMSPTGTLYVCDRGDQSTPNATRILSVSPTGVLTLFKGGLPHSAFIVCDPAGNVYAAVYSQNKVLKITPGGVVSDYATGLGTITDQLYQMSFDGAGNLYVGVEQGIYKVGPGGSPVTQIFDGAHQTMGHVQWAPDRFIVGTYGFRQLIYWSGAGLTNLLTTVGPNCTTTGHLAGIGVTPTATMFQPTGMRMRNGTIFVGDYGCHNVRSFDLALSTPTAGRTWGALKLLYR